MNRRHFEAIAAVLLSVRPPAVDTTGRTRQYEQWATTVRAFADMAATQNAQFKRVKFLEACGYME